MVGTVRTVSGSNPLEILMAGTAKIILLALPTAGMTAGAIGTAGMNMAGMTAGTIGTAGMNTAGMTTGAIGTTTEMPTAEMSGASGNNLVLTSPRGINSKTGNSSHPMVASNIVQVLPSIMQATRHRLNLPILPPAGQAIPIIPPALQVRLVQGRQAIPTIIPALRVRLARSPLLNPRPPGIPLCPRATLL
jgi:hypothetical protein